MPFKEGAGCYRTIGGVRWEWWTADNVDELRAHGIRCRRSAGSIFVHPDDEDRAWHITYSKAGS